MVTLLGCGFVPKANNLEIRMVKTPNFFFKIIDTILKNRLLQHIEQLVDINIQFAFIPNRSKEHMIHNILTSEAYTDMAFIIQLDISKAFDEVDSSIALRKIKKTMDRSTSDLIHSAVQSRYILHDSKDFRAYKQETKGVPQGTSTGPLLFIISLDEMLKKIRAHDIKIWAYADDMVIILPKNQKAYVKEVMNCVYLILKECSLTVNTQKTKILSLETIKKDGFWLLGEHIFYYGERFNATKYNKYFNRDLQTILDDKLKIQWTILKYIPHKYTKNDTKKRYPSQTN